MAARQLSQFSEYGSSFTSQTPSDHRETFPTCEWTSISVDGVTTVCGSEFQSVEAFLTHTREHFLKDCPRQSSLIVGEVYHTCFWKCCGWQTSKKSEFSLHFLYHPYHTYLKHLGKMYIRKHKLPNCELGMESCNIIPEFDGQLQCEWEGCSGGYDSAWDFYRHVEDHVRDVDPRGVAGQKKFVCEWTGCSFAGKTMSKLLEHSIVHTQRKVIACPTCGGLFASNAKLGDHLNRQKTGQGDKHVCEYCAKSYNTKRLLKTHMAGHINKYKCPHCDMSCPTLSALDSHIQWRHSAAKTFICQICKKAYKTESVLKRHIETHGSIDIDCPFPDCNFITNSAHHYKVHLDKHHIRQTPDHTDIYCCHECDSKFANGAELSQHLRTVHLYAPLPGHNRFRYVQCQDGTKRLQTTRIEKTSLVELSMN